MESLGHSPSSFFRSQVTRLPDISVTTGRFSSLQKFNNPGPGDYNTLNSVNDIGQLYSLKQSPIINPPHMPKKKRIEEISPTQ